MALVFQPLALERIFTAGQNLDQTQLFIACSLFARLETPSAVRRSLSPARRTYPELLGSLDNSARLKAEFHFRCLSAEAIRPG
jgi:hypothetical protein